MDANDLDYDDDFLEFAKSLDTKYKWQPADNKTAHEAQHDVVKFLSGDTKYAPILENFDVNIDFSPHHFHLQIGFKKRF